MFLHIFKPKKVYFYTFLSFLCILPFNLFWSFRKDTIESRNLKGRGLKSRGLLYLSFFSEANNSKPFCVR